MTSTRPVKVLHILHSLGMGGAETWLLELLRHWAPMKAVEMHFLATGGVRGEFDDEMMALGAKVHYIQYGRESLGEFTRRYRYLLKSEKFDALHDHSDLASGWHFLLGAGLLPPVRIAHVHNPITHLKVNYGKNRSRRLAMNIGRTLVIHFASQVCGTSSKALREYGFSLGAKHSATAVLHCGFAIDRFNAPREADRQSVRKEFGFPDKARLVLFAGRLDQDMALYHPRNHKNSLLAAHIGSAAIAQNANVKLLMVGAGDEPRAKLERVIADWGLSDHIKLPGVRKDIDRLMRSADLLLFPSADEGLGMVAVEAQAAGTPVLASNAIPDEAIVIPEMFQRVSLEASVEDWVRALLAHLDRPHPSSEYCREKMETSPYSIQVSAHRLERIYRSLSDTKAPGTINSKSSSPGVNGT